MQSGWAEMGHSSCTCLSSAHTDSAVEGMLAAVTTAHSHSALESHLLGSKFHYS